MDTEQLINYLASGDKNASELLDEIDPKLKKQFLKACKDLSKIVDRVRFYYPDANIYVQEDQPSLLLGCSHAKHKSTYMVGNESQTEVVAVTSHELLGKIDGGGW